MRNTRQIIVVLGLAWGCLAAAPLLAAQESGPAQPAAKDASKQLSAEPGAAENLVVEQEQIADRFKKLEDSLLRMAELTAQEDPRRADLLRKVVAHSKDSHIASQLEDIARLLEKEQLFQATKDQTEAHQNLNKLLELLLSEDRSKRLESEKERIRNYLARINRLIKDQKDLQGQTSGPNDSKDLANRQGGIADKTGQLNKDMQRAAADAAPGTNPKDPQDTQGQGKDGQPGDPQDGKNGQQGDSSGDKSAKKDGDKPQSDKDKNTKDKKDKDANKKDGDQKDKDGKQSGSPNGGQPSDGKQGSQSGDKQQKDGDKQKDDNKSQKDQQQGDKQQDKDQKSQQGGDQPSDPSGDDSQKSQNGKPSKGNQNGKQQDGGQQQQEGNEQPQEEEQQQSDSAEGSARKRIKSAEDRMQEAKKKLEEAKKHDAVDKQEEALRQLEQAKAELEQILRQLREEEVERTLTALETRFRKMLEMQTEVYESTKRVDATPEADRDRDVEIETGRLSRQESLIVVEADKALTLMREEGSAVAFPEAVVQMRDDMEQIVSRLSHSNTGKITQGIEEDVIKALEEMIAALKQAQKDAQQRKGQPQQQQQGEQQDDPLVDAIAELKMIKSLQLHVNTRHERYSKLVEGEQAADPELIDALQRLKERELRIHRVTRDIVVGRNQ